MHSGEWVTEARADGVCDFCMGNRPAWRYPAQSFEMPGFRWRSVGDWAACERCSRLIEKGDYKRLAELGPRVRQEKDPEARAFLIASVMAMQGQFVLHRTGPAIRLIDQ